MSTPEEKAQKAAYMQKWRAALPLEKKVKMAARQKAKRATITSEERKRINVRDRTWYYEKGGRTLRTAASKRWRDANPEKIHGMELRRAERRAGRPMASVCEVCGDPPRAGERRLHFDHDHRTLEFRGWLCSRCNTTLGFVNDDIELLDKMIVYLARSRRPRLVRHS
jgi:hypothetical protein